MLKEVKPNPVLRVGIECQDGAKLFWRFQEPIQQTHLMFCLGAFFKLLGLKELPAMELEENPNA